MDTSSRAGYRSSSFRPHQRLAHPTANVSPTTCRESGYANSQTGMWRLRPWSSPGSGWLQPESFR